MDIDAGFKEHLKNLLALGDEIFLAGTCELYPEAAQMCVGAVVFRREIFNMDVAARPARGCGLKGLEHRIWSAAIKMRVRRCRDDSGSEVQELPACLIVKMQMDRLRIEFLQVSEKGHVLARTAGIIELPVSFACRQLLHHAPDRRDADATGDEYDGLGILDQREIVARRADLDLIAGAHFLDDVARAAAACGITLDANDIAIRIGIRRDQRELPN